MKNCQSKRKGFTLVEILVVIVIIVVLAGAIAPVGKGMMARSRAVNCAGNLRQIGMASMMYAGENNMTLPVTSHERNGMSWTKKLQEVLEPYASDIPLVFKCPDDEDKSRDFSYKLNDFLTPNPEGADHLNYSILAKIDAPNETFLFAEALAGQSNSHFHFAQYNGGKVPPAVFSYQVAVEAHSPKANYLFVDGHVETLSWKETQGRLAARGSRFVDPSVVR